MQAGTGAPSSNSQFDAKPATTSAIWANQLRSFFGEGILNEAAIAKAEKEVWAILSQLKEEELASMFASPARTDGISKELQAGNRQFIVPFTDVNGLAQNVSAKNSSSVASGGLRSDLLSRLRLTSGSGSGSGILDRLTEGLGGQGNCIRTLSFLSVNAHAILATKNRFLQYALSDGSLVQLLIMSALLGGDAQNMQGLINNSGGRGAGRVSRGRSRRGTSNGVGGMNDSGVLATLSALGLLKGVLPNDHSGLHNLVGKSFTLYMHERVPLQSGHPLDLFTS